MRKQSCPPPRGETWSRALGVSVWGGTPWLASGRAEAEDETGLGPSHLRPPAKGVPNLEAQELPLTSTMSVHDRREDTTTADLIAA